MIAYLTEEEKDFIESYRAADKKEKLIVELLIEHENMKSHVKRIERLLNRFEVTA